MCVCVCVCTHACTGVYVWVHAHAHECAPMPLKSQFLIIWPVLLKGSMYVGACKNYEVEVIILSFKNVGS